MLIFKQLTITEGDRSDYLKLHRYHYCKQEPGQLTHVFCIRPRDHYRKYFPNPIGVHTFSMPMPNLRARTIATNGFFKIPKTRSEQMKLVNEKIRYASRIIIDPRFHNLGLAKWFIRDTLPKVGFPIIETLVPIDYTNRVFSKAGFEILHTPSPSYYRKLTDAISSMGLTVDFRLLPETFQKRLEKLVPEDRLFLEQTIEQFLSRFKSHHNMKPDINRAKFLLSKIFYPNCYLIWFNPKMNFSS